MSTGAGEMHLCLPKKSMTQRSRLMTGTTENTMKQANEANEANESDKRKDREDRGEEDSKKVTQDAEAEGEHGAEEAGDELERYSKTIEKEVADKDQQREEEMGNHD